MQLHLPAGAPAPSAPLAMVTLRLLCKAGACCKDLGWGSCLAGRGGAELRSGQLLQLTPAPARPSHVNSLKPPSRHKASQCAWRVPHCSPPPAGLLGLA